MHKPIGDVVLVKIPKLEEKTKGGIILTDTARERLSDGSDIGIIQSLGPKAFEDQDEIPVKEGDWVHFRRYAGIYVSDMKQGNYRYITDLDIFGVVDKTELSNLYEVE